MKRPSRSAMPHLLIGVGLMAPLGTLPDAPAAAQGYGLPYSSGSGPGPAPYAPPRGGVRPIDQSPRDTGGIRLYQPSIWEGLYLGAHLGGDFGTIWATLAPDNKLDLGGVSGGLHLGYNWQRSGFVGGIEFDADGKSTDGSRTDLVPAGSLGSAVPLRFDGHAEWLSSARLRFGYAFGNGLLYATGGYAVGEMTVRASALGGSIKTSEVMQGYVLGGGIEWKFSPNISARLEGLHYEFAEKTFNFGPASVRGDAELTTVRAGLTYHFN